MEGQNKDVKEEFQRITNLNDRIHKLADKYFSVTKWFMNVSIAVLGFYIAMLLQLKFNGSDIASYFSVIVLILLILSILVGLCYNLFYETFDITRQQKVMELEKALYSKETEFEPDKLRSASKYKLKMISHGWIGTHFVIFLLSIVGVATYLINVLFF